MTSCLPDWAASLAPWPVVTWPQFVEFLHQAVNPLAGEEHLKEVTQQLQLMGELVYLKAEEADLVVLRPAWLCSDLLGAVLGRELRQLVPGPALTRPQLQEAACQVPGLDTLTSCTRDLLQLLAALGLATETREEEEAEHELPVFSRPEAAGDGEAAQWRRDPDTWTHYGGVTLRCGHPQLAAALWPRVQTMLRRSVARKPGPGHGWQLEQSAASSCVAAGRLQARVTSPGSSGAMAVTVRGMGDTARQCFYFLEEILGIIDQVLYAISSVPTVSAVYTIQYPPGAAGDEPRSPRGQADRVQPGPGPPRPPAQHLEPRPAAGRHDGGGLGRHPRTHTGDRAAGGHY